MCVLVTCVLLFAMPISCLAKPVGTQAGAAVLAFALVFGISFLAGKFLARALGDRTRKSILGPVDRVLGLGFGALKGLIGATLLFMLASLLYETVYGGGAKRPEWMTTSRCYPLLNASGKAISEFVAVQIGRAPDLTSVINVQLV